MTAISIAQLATMVHSSSRRHKVLVLLRAYFDESGSHAQSDIVLIAGFVGPSSLWMDIESDWASQLVTARVPYFHASECEAGQGVYSTLSRGLRESLFNGLAGVICKHRPMAVSAAVIRGDWDTFRSGEIGKRFVDPYNLCFEYCIQKISSWSKEEANGEPTALVFAEQKQHEPRADQIYKLYRNNPRWGRELASLTFALPENVIPLQAADFIAYETYRYAVSRQRDPKTPLRPALKKMVEADVRAVGGYYDAEALAELLKQSPGQL